MVINQEKDDGVKMVLSYCLQKNVKCRANDLNVKAISFATLKCYP